MSRPDRRRQRVQPPVGNRNAEAELGEGLRGRAEADPDETEAERIALRLRDLPSGEVEEAIPSACAGDPQLVEEVRALLASFDLAEAFFRRVGALSGALMTIDSAEGLSEDAEVAAPPEDPLPDRLGPWKVLDLLGRGGMGRVYLCEREDADYLQRAAVKVLRTELTSGPFKDRFLAERRILATLTHPGIAQFIEGGWLPDGQPYLALEFVEGEDLIVWADARNLGLRERVRLFLQVCRAMEHAHQRLVVHRDLKPSNTRVTTEGSVKLLDFGIARVLQPGEDEAGDGEITRLHPFAGRALTPAYASPEQIRGDPVSTASDIYSMGVLLWRLLAGELPGVREGRRERDPDTDPSEVHPGEVLRAEGRLEQEAERRGLAADRFQRELRGDLTAILQTCVRPEPWLRYGSVGALAGDLERYLDGHPVSARSGSRAYRLKKFVVRNAWGVAAGLVGLLALAGAAGGSWMHSVRVEAERDRATLEAERAQTATAFLVDLFAVAGEGTAFDTVRAGTLLERGEDRLRERTEAQPLLRAELLLALAEANDRLQRTGASSRLREERLALLEASLGESTLAFARELAAFGRDKVVKQQWVGANEALARALHIHDEVVRRGDDRADPALRAQILSGLALALRFVEERDAAVAAGLEALEIRQSLARTEGDAELLSTMADLASALRGADRGAEAENLLRRVLAEANQPEARIHPRQQARIHNDLGALLRASGRLDDAEPHYREALALLRASEGGDGNNVETLVTNLVRLLADAGRHEESEAAALSFRSDLLETHPPDHWRLGRAHLRVGWSWLDSENCSRGLPWLEEGAAIYSLGLGPEHAWTAGARMNVAECLIRIGREDEAEATLRWALPVMASAREPNRPQIAAAAAILANHLDATGREAEARQVRAQWDVAREGG